MTVAELIQELQKHDPQKRVVVSGYEGGFCDITAPLEEKKLLLNVNTAWYYGPHESSEHGTEAAILIG